MELSLPENADITGLAYADVVEEFEWYFQRSEKAAFAFLRELEKAFNRAATRLRQWPIYSKKARYVQIHRYPIIVIFEIVGDRIRILVVAHGKTSLKTLAKSPFMTLFNTSIYVVDP